MQPRLLEQHENAAEVIRASLLPHAPEPHPQTHCICVFEESKVNTYLIQIKLLHALSGQRLPSFLKCGH